MLDALAERCRRMLLKNNKGIVIRHLEYLWCDTHTDTVGTARFVIDSNFHDPPICGHFFLHMQCNSSISLESTTLNPPIGTPTEPRYGAPAYTTSGTMHLGCWIYLKQPL